MRVGVVGGLCNRLRAIFDWKVKLAARDEPLVAVWAPDHYVSFAKFSDVLGPLPGIEVAYEGPVDHVALDELKPDEAWMRLYQDLMPTYGLQARIAECKRRLGEPYNAVHARGGDHKPHARNRGWPQLSGYAVGDMMTRPERVFYACDSAALQALAGGPSDKIVMAEFIRGGDDKQDIEDHRRHTTLQHAVVDLFVCAGAKHFLGTPGSSFSETIDILRWLAGLRESPPELVSLT